jgi:hypothetical protein
MFTSQNSKKTNQKIVCKQFQTRNSAFQRHFQCTSIIMLTGKTTATLRQIIEKPENVVVLGG